MINPQSAFSKTSINIAIVLLYASVFVFVKLWVHGFDASTFITAGDVFVDAKQTPSPISVLAKSTGYDGQFYYRIALTPFTKLHTEYGVTLDSPSHRQQRILYPLLSRIISLGNPSAIPWAMIFVNIAGLCSIALFATLLMLDLNRNPLYALCILFLPVFILALSRDLVEITATWTSLGAFYFLFKNKLKMSGLFFTAAMFARETTLIFPMAVALNVIIAHRKNLLSYWPLLFPFTAYMSWQAYLDLHWGTTAVEATSADLGLPFLGLFHLFLSIRPRLEFHTLLMIIEISALITFALGTFFVLLKSNIHTSLKFAWLLAFILTSCLTYEKLWVNDWNFLRGILELVIAGTFILVGNDIKQIRFLPLIWLPISILFMVTSSDFFHYLLGRLPAHI
jgi:hypothetical protein